tara:strand:+ start:202 stop:948 length:747 start_codon:yes stop_codon:yes gene_type:complete
MNKLYVISTGRNANKFVNNCILSIQNQTYACDKHIVIDDVSDDNTISHLSKHISLPNIEVKLNKERKYRLRNIYDNAVNKDPEDIICIVDSDDWLTDNTALQKIIDAYDSDDKIEYVHSQYIIDGAGLGCSKPIPNKDWDPYGPGWITSHISTFKAKALQSIPINNFLDWNGKWFEIATDHALTLPILYRLRQRDGDYSAVKFINEPLYTHLFHGNPSKPRSGTAEADLRATLAVKCSTYIKRRGYVK